MPTATQPHICHGCSQPIRPGQPTFERDEQSLLTTWTRVFCSADCAVEMDEKDGERWDGQS